MLPHEQPKGCRIVGLGAVLDAFELIGQICQPLLYCAKLAGNLLNLLGQLHTMKKKIQIAAAAIVAILVLIIVLQNTETVETKLLFATISMPRAAMLFGTLLIGFVVGALTSRWLVKKPK